MAIRLQSWQPDTHDAVFVTQWDDENPDAPHVCISATVGGVEAADPQAAYETVLAQNQTKNMATQTLLGAMSQDLKKVRLDQDGDPAIDYILATLIWDVKQKFHPTATVDPDTGKVTLAVPHIDQPTIDALHAAVTAVHGEAVEVIAAQEG